MDDAQLRVMFEDAKTIAIVGISDRPDRPSHRIASYLKDRGYQIIPVNPKLREVLGEKAYPSLAEIPDKVDIVDIFRRSEFVEPIVDEAIGIGARAVWMQDGVDHPESADRARQAGLNVVVNDCIFRVHSRLFPARVTRS